MAAKQQEELVIFLRRAVDRLITKDSVRDYRKGKNMLHLYERLRLEHKSAVKGRKRHGW